MKLYEFISNNDVLLIKLRQLIYFDEKWMFPNTDIVNSFLTKSLKTDIPKQFNVLSKKVVDELNKRDIHPSDFSSNFDIIIKEFTTA
jgi:hypothetical protein